MKTPIDRCRSNGVICAGLLKMLNPIWMWNNLLHVFSPGFPQESSQLAISFFGFGTKPFVERTRLGVNQGDEKRHEVPAHEWGPVSRVRAGP